MLITIGLIIIIISWVIYTGTLVYAIGYDRSSGFHIEPFGWYVLIMDFFTAIGIICLVVGYWVK